MNRRSRALSVPLLASTLMTTSTAVPVLATVAGFTLYRQAAATDAAAAGGLAMSNGLQLTFGR